MRKHMLGSSPMAGGWSPRFARSTAAHTQDAPRNHTVREVSRVTTLKRGRRSISLYYRSHIKLATLLEADPDVVHWNSAALANAAGMMLPNSAHFFANRADRYEAIRVGDPFSDEDKTNLQVRGILPRSIRQEKLARDGRLPVAETLIYYRSQPLPTGFVTAAILALSDRMAPQTLGQLRDRLSKFEPAWEQILTLVGAGYVKVVLATAINDATSITGMNPEGWQ